MPVHVVFIDLDNFKAFNTTYGHEGGDKALRAVGKIIRKHCKGLRFIAARFGGDEMVIIVYGDAAEANLLALRLHQAINGDPERDPEQKATGLRIALMKVTSKPDGHIEREECLVPVSVTITVSDQEQTARGHRLQEDKDETGRRTVRLTPEITSAAQ